MAQGAALGGPHQVDEQLAFKRHAFIKLLLGGSLDRVHTLGGRGEVLRHALDHVARELEVGVTQRVFTRQVAHQRQGAAVGVFGGHFAGKRQGFFGQRLRRCRHLVKQLLARQRGQHFALDRLAADDHVECGFHTHHTWQALRATRAGNEAELDFRQGHTGAWGGNTVVRAQGQFQATAHTHRVDGCNDGFGRVFECQDDAEQIGLL